jgi:hypothetical protein
MRKLLALAAAVGFAIALSAPASAATIDFSAAKKKVDCSMEKNKMKKACKGMNKTDLGAITFSAAKKKKIDCSMEKNKMNKACAAKKTDLEAITFSAAKKKVDCTMEKNKMKKACKGM